MALTIEKLRNEDRFAGDSIQFLLYLPFGLVLLVLRVILGFFLWVAAILLPDKSSVRHLLSILACCTFGVYVKLKGKRDPRSSVLVANYVSTLDSLAASHALGTITLRKWKVPPFFASTLGIRSASQFARKQHFADSPSTPILLQPEGGPTNGRGLLKFTDWPFPLGNRVQPVAIKVERILSTVTVHGSWTDALWYLWAPVTVYTVTLLPPHDREDLTHEAYVRDLTMAIANELKIEATEFTWKELVSPPRTIPLGGVGGVGGVSRSPPPARALRVKEVLPHVPIKDILKDLDRTNSVDVTITNFLEGVTLYTPEVVPEPQPTPSTSQPKYVTPQPTGVFLKTARERHLGFQEKKAAMIAEARRKYIEKHGLDVSLNTC